MSDAGIERTAERVQRFRGAVGLRLIAEGTHRTYLASMGQMSYKLIIQRVNRLKIRKKWSCDSENII